MPFQLSPLSQRFHPLLAAALLADWLAAIPALADLPVAPELAALTDPVGQSRLLESEFKQAYWPLSIFFETQKNQAYCAVASSVIALNALGIPRPQTKAWPDFAFFTQDDFFAGIDPNIANPITVSKEGMTLAQLAEALKAFPVAVEPHFGQDLSLEQFRELLKRGVSGTARLALVNFGRKLIHEVGGGHWSPIAAYHAPSDSALLMDVARYKYPPVWVAVKDLHEAVRSIDDTSHRSRGLLLVERR